MSSLFSTKCDDSSIEMPISGEPPTYFGMSFHEFGLEISLVTTIFACVMTGLLVFAHLMMYSKPLEQRYIIRILLMVPIYSACSYFSMLQYEHAIYWNLGFSCYEAFAISSFFSLLCSYMSKGNQEGNFRALWCYSFKEVEEQIETYRKEGWCLNKHEADARYDPNYESALAKLFRRLTCRRKKAKIIDFDKEYKPYEKSFEKEWGKYRYESYQKGSFFARIAPTAWLCPLSSLNRWCCKRRRCQCLDPTDRRLAPPNIYYYVNNNQERIIYFQPRTDQETRFEQGRREPHRAAYSQFRYIHLGVYQYVAIKPASTVFALLLKQSGHYCETSWSLIQPHFWVTFFQVVSPAIAMYCLLQLFEQLRYKYRERRIKRKLVALKIVVLFCFYQNIIIGVYAGGHPKGTGYIAYPDLSIGLPALLLCGEMCLLSFLNVWAYDPRAYKRRFVNSDEYLSYAMPPAKEAWWQKKQFLGIFACFHTLNPIDVIGALIHSFFNILNHLLECFCPTTNCLHKLMHYFYPDNMEGKYYEKEKSPQHPDSFSYSC